MSATLGGESDLLRAYGLTSVALIRAQSSQWGRRYIFIPGVYVSPERAIETTAKIWDGIQPRRAVLLAPSDHSMARTFQAIRAGARHSPTRFGASDITNSLDPFVTANDAMLTLAGRYDGLDLPDDQCRLLIMSQLPSAINPLERHLTQRWKLGPITRQRERTRLIQGLGRCTRSATDFAVVIWLGQSLVDISTSSSVLERVPAEIAQEIAWGVRQSELASRNSEELVEMALGLLVDPQYRLDADGDIQGVSALSTQSDDGEYAALAAREVRYGRAIWDDDPERATELAKEIADHVASPELAGYRAWWLYLMGSAAWMAGASAVATDSFRRAANCGVNSGWIRGMLRATQTAESRSSSSESDQLELNTDAVWDHLDNWGWAGPRFQQNVDLMRRQLGDPNHTEFHQGLDALGKCLGAQTTRTTEDGAPDVVWSFPEDLHFAFEAKTEKGPAGSLSKGDLLETKGHRDWVRERLCGGRDASRVETIVVSGTSALHHVATPFASDVYYISPGELSTWCDEVVQSLTQLRIRLSGATFAAAARTLSVALRANQMDIASITKRLTASPLKD